MAITTFTAAQVLTAAQMNAVQSNDFNQTVSTKTASYTLVAADKGTRVVMNAAGATTITVNTSLFSAGDTLVLQNIGAGVCTVTAGTATVSSAGPLAIPQNGSGTLYFTSAGVSIFLPSAVTVAAPAASGLTLITSGTVSAGLSVSILNAFSTTYDFYTMRFSDIKTTTDNTEFNMQLGTAGVADTASTYTTQGYRSITTVGNLSSRSSASFIISENMGLIRNNLVLEIGAPFLTTYTTFNSQSYTNFQTDGAGHQLNGIKKTSTSYTDMFFLNNNSDNIGPFTFALFGYAK